MNPTKKRRRRAERRQRRQENGRPPNRSGQDRQLQHASAPTYVRERRHRERILEREEAAG